jgi:hypothetical protein
MRRRTRRLAVAAAVVVLVVVALRLALDPVATWRTRRSLAALRGMQGTVADVEVHVAPPSVALHGVRLEKVVEGRRVPFVEVERATLRLEWRELLRGRIVSRADVESPKVHVIQRGGSGPKVEPGEHQRVQEAPRSGSGLERLGALGVDRAQVRGGELLFAEARDPGTPILRLHDIELSIEGLSSRRPAKERQPMVLAGRATLQRTGKVSVFATADPAGKAPTFAGRASLTGLRFEELHALVAGKSAIAPSRGSFDLAASSRRWRAGSRRASARSSPARARAPTSPASPRSSSR